MKLSPAELARVEGYLNERRGDMVDTLCRLVSIPSVSRNDRSRASLRSRMPRRPR